MEATLLHSVCTFDRAEITWGFVKSVLKMNAARFFSKGYTGIDTNPADHADIERHEMVKPPPRPVNPIKTPPTPHPAPTHTHSTFPSPPSESWINLNPSLSSSYLSSTFLPSQWPTSLWHRLRLSLRNGDVGGFLWVLFHHFVKNHPVHGAIIFKINLALQLLHTFRQPAASKMLEYISIY